MFVFYLKMSSFLELNLTCKERRQLKMFYKNCVFLTAFLIMFHLDSLRCEEAPKKIYVTPVNNVNNGKSKSGQTQDNAQANSNAYEYIEEVRPIHYSGHGYGYGDNEMPAGYSQPAAYDGGYGSGEDTGSGYNQPYTQPYSHSYSSPYSPKAIEHRYYTIRKSKSLFSDDVGFVVIIVGLTVFFGAIS